MILLDTDHISALKYTDSDSFRKLTARMADSVDQDFATTVITLEEQMRGWLVRIHKIRPPAKQVPFYSELTGLLEFFGFWTISDFDQRAAEIFADLRSQRIRGGSMDLKIASIALANDCLLLTGNTFSRVKPLLRVDW